MVNEQSIFAAAIEKATPAERASLLAEACVGDDSLRARVERLLAIDERAAGILDRGPAIPKSGVLTADTTFAGRFELRHKLGEGGMGEVWVADQFEPVRRRVALKVIRPGLDSQRLLARFEQERQALARMEHPNIAKVLEAGIADDAGRRPFVVMELIDGVPITQYCDSHRLSTRERLELFVPVCQAVQHAHQKGIIHRDLKPSNILVGEVDGQPVPKVIDFGVAKATGPRLTEADIETEVGSLVGTLEYMSPEQAELDNLDIDTRTDIYALGTILHELLTGTVPFPRGEYPTVAILDRLRIIKEVEPIRPSAKLSASKSLAEVAASRNTDPKRLIALLRGELDWIVAKCLEKDRSRRYETANGLSADLRRFLANDPIFARPPSTAYRVQKFIRRNRAAVLAGTAILLALVGGMIGTSVAMVEARRQRDAADAAERLAAERLIQVEGEKARSDVERGIAQATNDFLLKDLLEQAFVGNQQFGTNPSTLNPKITVREVLDRANSVIEGKFAGQPLVEAAVRSTLSDTYRRLGEYGPAIVHAQRAVDLRKGQLADDHPDVLNAEKRLARAYSLNGQHQEATRLLEKVRDAVERTHGPDDLATLDAIQSLAYACMRAGRSEDATAMLERVHAARLRVQSFEHPDCLDAVVHLARLYARSKRADEAVVLLERVREVFRKSRHPDDPEVIFALETLAIGYSNVGRTTEAVEILRQVRDSRARVLDPDHPATLDSISNLARALMADGRVDEAISLFQRMAEAQQRKLPPGHISTLITLSSLANAYQKANRFDKSIETYELLRDITEKRYGPDHGQTLASQMKLGQAYEAAGNIDRAIEAYRQASEGAERVKLRLELRFDYSALLSRAYEKRKQFDLAETLWRGSVETVKREAGVESKRYAEAQVHLGRNLVLQRKWVECESLLKDALAVLEAKYADDWATFFTRSVLGSSLLGQKKYAEAEGHLVRGCEGLLEREAKIPSHETARLTEALEHVAQLYDAWSKPNEAAKWRMILAERSKSKK